MYYEREEPEVYVEEVPAQKGHEGEMSYNSPREIDIENIERNVENEDMLAITQHNQQQIVKNAQLDRVSEQHTYRENATDRHTKSVSNHDSMPQIHMNKPLEHEDEASFNKPAS